MSRPAPHGRFLSRVGFGGRRHPPCRNRGRYDRALRLEPLEDRRLLAGVTLITHGGWSASIGDSFGWVTGMANAIANRLPDPGNTSIWTLGVTDSGGSPRVNVETRDSGPDRFTQDYNGESIIKLDWSNVQQAHAGQPLGDSTIEVAIAVADYLLTTTKAGKTWLDAPLHLIGHSRGASLVGALAENLAAAGVWVDQVTYFDPYPILGDYGFSGNDTFSETVTNNVTFADNYMHRVPYPDVDLLGTHVVGTHEQQLDGLTLGYPGNYAGHSNMHLWYQGTIQTSDPISDGELNNFYAGANGWYSGSLPSRTASGFYYSQIAGGARPSDGFSYLLGGAGDRQQVNVTESAWPNVIYLATDLPNVQVMQGCRFTLGIGIRTLTAVRRSHFTWTRTRIRTMATRWPRTQQISSRRGPVCCPGIRMSIRTTRSRVLRTMSSPRSAMAPILAMPIRRAP